MKERLARAARALGAGMAVWAFAMGAASAATSSHTVTATTGQSSYVAGATNTFTYAVGVVVNGTVEYVDNIGFTFPAGVTVTSATGPSPYNFCGGGQGNYTNPTSNSVLWSTPGHPTGCGAFATGTFNFSVTVNVPANFSGPLTAVMTSTGDGWPAPLNDGQVTNIDLVYMQDLPQIAVPTLGGWGLGLLAMLLAGASLAALRRRAG